MHCLNGPESYLYCPPWPELRQGDDKIGPQFLYLNYISIKPIFKMAVIKEAAVQGIKAPQRRPWR